MVRNECRTTLTLSTALAALAVAGCSSSGSRGASTATRPEVAAVGAPEHGTVAGLVLLQGGPEPGKETPASGVVYAFTAIGLTGKPVATARTGPRGRFRLNLPPGTYYLAASSPSFVPDARSATPPCHGNGPAVVSAGTTSH